MNLERALSGLRVAPPAEFPNAVLHRLGLVDDWAALSSPVGTVHVAFNDRGVCYVHLTGDQQAFQRAFTARFGRPLRPARQVPAVVTRAVRAGRVVRGLRLDLTGVAEFQRAVLAKTAEIPAGEVRSYRWVAAQIGRPAAVRAVGGALARNPVPLLIPCHRVVRGDGGLGGYAFGLPVKRALLAAEGADVAGDPGRAGLPADQPVGAAGG